MKDEAVAKKMAYFIEVSTIGVSHDAQVRATQLLRVVVRNAVPSASSGPIQLRGPSQLWGPELLQQDMFRYGYSIMDYRWRALREALEGSKRFRLPEFEPAHCSFFGQITQPTPGTVSLQTSFRLRPFSMPYQEMCCKLSSDCLCSIFMVGVHCGRQLSPSS